jgi:hypothetical protein
MYPDSEILFPPRCIKQLRDLRGPKWRQLVDRILNLPHNHEEVLAFGLLLIDEGSCLTCDLDSYRASLGCCTCAQRTINGFKGDDDELMATYHDFLEQVQTYVEQEDLPLTVELMLQDKVPSVRRR